MNSMRNRVHLIGNPGADPELREFDKGGKLARFSLATNDSYKNAKGEKVENTQWHQIVAWNKTAELVDKLIKKGKEVAVEGKLITRSYEDNNGQKRYATEVVLDEFLLLGNKGSDN